MSKNRIKKCTVFFVKYRIYNIEIYLVFIVLMSYPLTKLNYLRNIINIYILIYTISLQFIVIRTKVIYQKLL